VYANETDTRNSVIAERDKQQRCSELDVGQHRSIFPNRFLIGRLPKGGDTVLVETSVMGFELESFNGKNQNE
jgi:hypothetical protein